MFKLDQQIAKGTEKLLLLAPVDIPAASSLLAQWRKQRDELQVNLTMSRNPNRRNLMSKQS